MTAVPDVLDEDDTEQMTNSLANLEEQVKDIDYKNAELKEELKQRIAYADERVKLMKERIIFHQDQRARAVTALTKLGVVVEGSAAGTTLEDEDEEILPATPKKKKAGGGRAPKGDNKYSIKEAVELVVKGVVEGLSVEEIAQKVQLPEENGGAGYKTEADTDSFKTSIMNSGVRTLLSSGALIPDPAPGRTKKYIHISNVDALLASA